MKLTKVSAEAKSALHDEQIRVRIFIKHIALSCIFENGFRGRLWTIRQYSGFGTAEESNERYKFLLDQGQTGLSVALDLPTQCGYDPTDSMARAEVGKVGVSLSNLGEVERLFKGIDVGGIST